MSNTSDDGHSTDGNSTKSTSKHEYRYNIVSTVDDKVEEHPLDIEYGLNFVGYNDWKYRKYRPYKSPCCQLLLAILYLFIYWALFCIVIFGVNLNWYFKLIFIAIIICLNLGISFLLLTKSKLREIRNKYNKISLNENIKLPNTQKQEFKDTKHFPTSIKLEGYWSYPDQMDSLQTTSNYHLPLILFNKIRNFPNFEHFNSKNARLTHLEFRNHLRFNDIDSGSNGSLQDFQRFCKRQKYSLRKAPITGYIGQNVWKMHFGGNQYSKTSQHSSYHAMNVWNHMGFVHDNHTQYNFTKYHPYSLVVYRTPFICLENSKWKRFLLYLFGFVVFGLFEAWFSCFDNDRVATFQVTLQYAIYSDYDLKEKLIHNYISTYFLENNHDQIDIQWLVDLCKKYIS